jgi:hypothetical protein
MQFPNFFGGNKQQQPANNQQQQQQPTNQQNQPGNTPNNGATLPQNQNKGQPGNDQNAGNQPNNNPLDAYSKLFDNPAGNGDTAPAFAIDPKIMDQVTSSQDFTQGIDPAVMQKALQGDGQSFIEIIQHVGRNSYRAAIEHGGMLTDKFVGAREKHGEGRISSKVRSELTTHALSNTPNFQHPVVKRQLVEIAQRFQAQNPDASPQDIAEMSKKYMSDLMSAISPQQQQAQNNSQQNQEERGEEYWADFFNEGQG